MSKKIISSVVVVALLVGIFLVTNPFSPATVMAEEYRGGFSLVPLDSDSTGVKPDSSFTLKSQNPISLEQLTAILSIDGEPAPNITEQGTDIFNIKPFNKFEQNKLYTFRINREGQTDITWTFQTSAVFKIINNFPSDKSTNVPVNTGIEIYFSHEDYENIDKYFEIVPSTKGTFERHKRAVVFVPDELKEGTVYTITIKKGVKLEGSEYSLAEDYSFMFETGFNDYEQQNTFYKGRFYYNRTLNEYTPEELPYLAVNYYINKREVQDTTLKVQTAVYAYKDIDSFIDALNEKNSIPMWASINYFKNFITTENLSKVTEFEQEFSSTPREQQFIKIPQTLPAGYYIVDSKWEDVQFQTFIQVTEIGMYIMKASNKTLIWLNDLISKQPLEQASISLFDEDKTFYTDSEGIAYFDSLINENTKEQEPSNYNKYFKIVTEDGRSAILNYYSYTYWYNDLNNANFYWNYLFTDRNLYKPNDTVNFWGFIKNRYADEEIESLTLEIGQGYSYIRYDEPMSAKSSIALHCFPIESQPMIRQTLQVKNGVFEGSINLPNLEPGGYQFTIKKGDNIILSSYLSIENYVKPAYKLEITRDKEAVFPGQEVNFDIKASFFEGTGIPDLDLSYNINNRVGDRNISAKQLTDSTGSVLVKYIPKPSSDVQGERQTYLYTHASLPEIGEISQNSSVRVFVNDINVNITSETKDNIATINSVVNKIVLDRLNDGTAEGHNDYLGDPVADKTLSGTLYKNTWEKVEDGQYYDFINKVTRKRYRYNLKTEPVKSFSMTTDEEGTASFTFDAAEIVNGYYSAKLACADNSNRNMKFDIYISKHWRNIYNYYDDNRYHLDGGEESYALGETVNLTYKKGQTALPEGSYLFIKTQNGIKEYATKDTPEYSFNLQKQDLPNVYITGVYFNGITYAQSEHFNAVFDSQQNNLVIEAQTSKDSYKPGEEAVIKITAKDKYGNGVKSIINASVVDEALFKLREQYVDTLMSLYSNVPSGIDFTYSSHINSGIELSRELGKGGMDESIAESLEAPQSAADNGMMKSQMDVSFSEADTAYIREVFKDTAFFKTITLDENGYGELKFKLPDNVTSWRITLTGLTDDLHAGSNKTSLNVTLPFFINYTLNSTYLVGDKPVIGVNAYGNNLNYDDAVRFEVVSSSNPERIATAEGKAFERINIPLWELEQGMDDIIIKAYGPNGLSDSIKHPINTVLTYNQIDSAIYYDLTADLKFEGGSYGNTKLTFSDKGRGMFLPEITSLMHSGGNRVDQKLSQKIASELVEKYFAELEIGNFDSSFNVSDYQKNDGGIALLPYGSSDIDISAKLSSIVKDAIDSHRLKQYFYSILFDDSPGLKGNALYGLAVLKEPVLLELDKAADVENASIKDIIYIALAYCELGETPKAEKIYTEKVLSGMEEYEPFIRINTGSDNDDILEVTSLASILASKLNKEHKEGLYQYCISNAPKDILVNIEKLLYIASEIEKHNNTTAKITYSYLGEEKTKVLENGRSFTLTIPSQNLNKFKIVSFEGDISMVSVFKKEIAGVDSIDQNISVDRKYYVKGDTHSNTNTFKQNDIIRVELTYNIGPKAIDGSYEITDYLPSGLKAIKNTANFGISPERGGYYTRIDGQKVTFYAYNDQKNEQKTLSYYARVITPGTYKADAAIIQGIASRDSVNIGNVDVIVIK